MRYRNAFFLLLLLVLGYFAIRQFRPTSPGKVQETIRIDTQRVDLLEIFPPRGESPILLSREMDGWIVSNGNWSSPAAQQAVTNLLASIARIPVYGLLGSTPQDWKAYGLGERERLRIVASAKGDKAADLLIGRPATDSLHRCFIRLTEHPEVFSVPDLALATIATDQEAYLDRRLLKTPGVHKVETWSYILPDTTFTFRKRAESWWLQDTLLLNTPRVETYLSDLVRLRGDHIYEAALLPAPTDTNKTFIAEVQLGKPAEAILQVLHDSSRTERPFLVQSSQFASLWYESDSSGLVRTLLRPVSFFLPPKDQ